MIYYIIIFLLFILSLYIYFFYKKRWFFIYSKYWLPYIFLLLAFLLSFISFFSYQINLQKNTKIWSSDIVFILDVSASMKALDYKEKSRLDIAKNFILNYVTNNLNNRYSLRVFSWDIMDLIPLTTDKNLFITFLQSVDERSVLRWWTNLSDALSDIILRFKDSKNGWTVVVISDFETNLDNFSKQNLVKKIEDINKKLIEKNIKLIFIWVWNKIWNKIIIWNDLFWNFIYKKDKFNNIIITKFDEDFFSKFSIEKYKINDLKDINKINFKDIPISDIELNMNSRIDISRYFMIISFLFFLIYLFLFSYFDKKWN